MRVQTIVYVSEMDQAVAWYRAVLGTDPATHGTHWASFRVGGANLALHYAEEALRPGKVELSLVVTEPLEVITDRLAASGIALHRGIADETFGRSLQLVDPEGLIIQVNEHDPELYEDE